LSLYGSARADQLGRISRSDNSQAILLSLDGSDDPGMHLFNYLRAKEVLLVLDNFEHLLVGIPLLVELLGHAPRMTVLVTSRERLNLAGEWVFELEGLPYPAPNHTERLEEYGAMQLFPQSAGRARPGFSLAAETAPAVARICQQMGGLPLGVELAASWTRVLSCAQIAQELERNRFSLSASLRDVPARHRNLRAAFDHWWHLLSNEERQIFRCLSVFRGGFTHDAAEAIASELSIENRKLRKADYNVQSAVLNRPESTRFSVLNLLAGLADKSLVRQDNARRNEMHELVQQYATAKLQEVPEEYRAAHDRHCDYYTSRLYAREEALTGADGPAVVAALTAEIDNLRAAWDWAIAHTAIRALRRAQFGLWYLYDAHSWHQEGATNCFRVPMLSGRSESYTYSTTATIAAAISSMSLGETRPSCV
jgi:predicted ATPase